MSALLSSLTSLKQRFEKLVSLHDDAKRELSILKAENSQLREQLESKDDAFSELQNKYDLLKLSKQIPEPEEDRTEMKRKINLLVREVDRCIALLNE